MALRGNNQSLILLITFNSTSQSLFCQKSSVCFMIIKNVTTDNELSDFLNTVRDQSEISIDLEFDKNFHRYGFNLCLVQIYDGETSYLIDPLSNTLTIERIFPLLEDPDVQKIVFAFGEDLRLLHSLGCFPKNVYDLGIVTSLLDYPQASLTNYLSDILGIESAASSQKSNWFLRPLTEKQRIYAAEDVFFLPQLKHKLQQEAEEKGITHWIEQENNELVQQDYSDTDNNSLYKEKDKNGFSELEWHICLELLSFRESLAELHDKPPFQVFGKNVIEQLIKNPGIVSKWNSMRGIFGGVKNKRTQNKLEQILKESRLEAEELGLSESEPAYKKPSKEKMAEIREEQKKIRNAKQNFFDPVKELIERDYGKETATFLFSNRILADIVTGKNGKLLPYKKELLEKYANELGIEPEF